MYAIFQALGKQYKVKEGDIIDIDLLETDQPKASFSEVLLIGNGDTITVGQPLVKGAEVTAEIVGEIKAPKVIAFKYRRRKGYHRTVGHRQKHTRVKITKIKA